MKKIKVAFILILSLVFLISCKPNEPAVINESAPIKNKYITFTLTVDSNSELTSEIYQFNLNDEKVIKIAEIPYTSQYPLTVYDKKHNVIYYTAKDSSGKSDQVFSYNVETKEIYQITDSFYAINYIIPFDSKIFIAGASKNRRNVVVSPYIYDLKKNKLRDIGWDNDLNISFVNYNPNSNEFIASGYSISKNLENIENQQNNIPYIEPTNYLFSINEDQHSLLYETQESIKSVVINNENYYFSNYKQNLFKLNRNKNIQEIVLNGIKFEKIIYISEDNNTIYYFYDKEIHKFEITKNDNTIIYKDKRKKCKINNAMILSY